MRQIDLANFQVATSETARDINRRIMLNLIRRREPISRADLARHSGLQPSTVSAITEQLLRERWIREGAIGHAPRGRRPRFLHLNSDRIGIVGINIRPARTTVAIADLDARFLAQETLPTGDNPAAFLAELSACVRQLVARHPTVAYEGIGVSLPGRLDLATHRLVFAPNLAWRDVDLRGELEAATGLPVELENAANACALAEVWFGQHTEGARNLIAITVSEGIGGGVILNGQLVRGTTGMAGEFGHVTVVEDGLPCRCGNRGCWEMYASNPAAVRYYTEVATPRRLTAATVDRRARAAARRNGGRADDADAPPTFDDILRRAEQDDPRAHLALDRMAHYLGAGIAPLVTGLAPDVIVIVGEVTRCWDRLGPIINRLVHGRVPGRTGTRIIPTDPSAQPRLRGTIALVLQKHFGAPSMW